MKFSLSPILRPALLLLATIAASPAQDAPEAPGRKILVADDSKRRLAVINPDGTFEREEKVTAIHDAHLLPNGNLLFQLGWNHIVEKSADGKIVWEYDSAKTNPGKRTEVHAFQRLADGNTMIAESGVSRIIEVTKEGTIAKEIKLQVDKPHPHRDTRLVRKTAAGTYLVAHEGMGMAREYDAEGKIIWEFSVPLPEGKKANGDHGPGGVGNMLYSAIRIANGNTLIGTGNGHSVIEVTPDKKVVWELKQNDLPGISLAWVCRVQRLENGNTVINNCHAGPNNPQLIEVTPDKKVVWQWKDFKNFGNSTPVGMVLPEK